MINRSVNEVFAELTFTLESELSGLRRLVIGGAVRKTMDSEVASLDRANDVLESRSI